MPLFSIVVTAYNNDSYLPGCLNSLAAQTFQDWECIVVNDASPDSTSEIAHRFASEDSRFKALDLPQNSGLHLARKAGLAQCGGQYVIFLDADDEFAVDGLADLAEFVQAHSVDMVHFGINVVSDGVSEQTGSEFGAYVNRPFADCGHDELLHGIFTKEGGYQQDWRVTQRAYSLEIARKAFDAMTDERLSRAEDCYECLVLADTATSQRTANDIRLLDYYYGRGVTGTSEISQEAFNRFVDEFCDCISQIKSYCGTRLVAEYEGSFAKLMDLLFNDWDVRLADADKEPCALYAAEKLGSAVAAEQVMRLARDKAYSRFCEDDGFGGVEEPCVKLLRLAESIAARAPEGLSQEYAAAHCEAMLHINLMERKVGFAQAGEPTLALRASYEEEPIRIFVTTHKDVETYHSNILQPVQVGPIQNRKRLMWAYQDDSGENIAAQNPMYCELTTQYWAWKNVQAEYYGFCHYRRYFDFSEVEHKENAYGEIMDGCICWGTQEEYCLDDAGIASAIEGYDIVTTGIKDLTTFPEQFATTRDHYLSAPYLKIQHLDRIIEILKEDQPAYAEDADAFLAGSKTCFCNMYVMRKDLFFRYCEWMFPLLQRFVNEWDTTLLSHEALRTPGHLSERLFNIWLNHEKRTNPELKHKEVQCVHFERPEHHASPKLPVANGAGKPVVPVVFAADNNYVPMVTTTAYSLLVNASPSYFYDIVVLEKDFSEENKQLMLQFFAQFENAQVRFANVTGMITEYNLQTSNEHISIETYYRFLIQKVLPGYDKVLYLDSDLLIQGDVAELFATELGGNLLAAAPDIDYAGNLNMNDGERMRYTREVLQMKDPYSYFQAGVLVLNLAEMRKLHTFKEWLEIAAEPKYIYDDQDILNAHCQGRVVYLDNAWNVMNDCFGRIKTVFSFAPAQMYDKFMEAYANPKIIHYAGGQKPWKPGPCDLQTRYWQYARKTPFYEAMVIAAAEVVVAPEPEPFQHEPAISEDSPLRAVFDGVLPMGSRRREAAKAAVRLARGRK